MNASPRPVPGGSGAGLAGGRADSGGRGARVSDLVAGPWGARFQGRWFPCSIGRNKAIPAAEKREGDLASPEGIWQITSGYWRPDRLYCPDIALPMQPLGPQQGWAEDPDDPAYNGPIRHPHEYAADRMRRGDPLYDICMVTDHNTRPVVPGAGSAIFVHLWRGPRRPTAGCIAFRRRDLEWILARWQPWSRLIIRPRGVLA